MKRSSVHCLSFLLRNIAPKAFGVVLLLICVPNARAAFGDIVAEYTFPASALVTSSYAGAYVRDDSIPEFCRDHQHKHAGD